MTRNEFPDVHSLGLRIDHVFAFIAVDTDGGEGVVAGQFSQGGPMIPFIGADDERMNQLRPYAQRIASRTGHTVKLIRFDTRTDVETLHP